MTNLKKINNPQKYAFRYTTKMISWLKEHYQTMPINLLVPAFNKKFGLSKTKVQIRGVLFRHGIRTARIGRYTKGNKPWNANTKGKGICKANKGSFKAGNKPHNTKYLGYERINKNGLIEISVLEKNPYTNFHRRFRAKHSWIWEQHNEQKIPPGHVVIFKDGNNRNFDPQNLLLVNRKELLRLNNHHYHKQPSELKPTIYALAKLEAIAGFKTK